MNRNEKTAGPVLLYHYANPKFAGLPWPAEGKPTKRKSAKKACVKKVFSRDAARAECARLRSASSAKWFWEFCAECQSFHVSRNKKAAPVETRPSCKPRGVQPFAQASGPGTVNITEGPRP